MTGAGRVEDAFNLLGHAAQRLLASGAAMAGLSPDELASAIDAPALVATSIKRGLDIDWNDPEQKAGAIDRLASQISRLEEWIRTKFDVAADRPPLAEDLATLAQLRDQNLEPDPNGGGTRVRRGVAEDRRVSIMDADMRHGRKSKSRTFNGYKSHLAADLDTGLVLACGVTPANRHEAEALPQLIEDIRRYETRNEIGELHVDRGYIASDSVRDLAKTQIPIISKPWRSIERGFFPKSDFKLDLGRMTISCPAGHTEKIHLGTTVHFPAATCAQCPLRARCTDASADRGRTISIAPDERLQKKLRLAIATPNGRERLRERVAIEHRLAHHARKQGTRARYVGLRKNIFDARRHSATLNLEATQLAQAA